MTDTKELRKKFEEDFKIESGLPDGYENWDNYNTALWYFIESSLLQQRKEMIGEIKKMLPTINHYHFEYRDMVIKDILNTLEKEEK